ncbi:hypothetical protein A3F00_02900 [Candidatus Daviesbacteria bacterium RIFCSPHIGHO2_12_FULL_37_11]|uniref:Uncharacterized protein n=1 Tax=Candidatus Daviesbacteria bacterium RIFCSPHIGHO2_12_FULL_37_11 TaxID=1797777 RepID=A0A1F5KBK3_9BACT|nr:MAG: hypothetical protein A2769_04190 [Candidatus Daviesbacteria bacterium RIFCSPHIGHO2_01_FULL_37_27]OGE38248.1 MAG: hypothetical protein A3F00_02900 [Candidatus Daviesbacteria bacterium RIFCSPHIGHO2_12_FULL_37_11]OGE46205.1 MAG: hypothetical protein A3B39_02665 [Candidatus Daviesbacteria bacterium RIFCSPLOWO2_01_FULL_37_10]
MSQVILFFKKHTFITVNIFVLLAAFFSFRYFIERILFPFVGMGWAYLIDQLVPLYVTIVASFFFLKRRTNINKVQARLKKHFWLLCLIFISALIVHLGILNYFFWAEEVNFILKPITQNDPFRFHLVGSSNMRGYFVSSYAFLYLVFGTKAWVYPLFSIMYFAISTLFVYWFIFLLTNKKSVAGLATLFFASTPAFLDMFTFHTTAHAPTLIAGLTSFICLLYYKRNYQKRGSFTYYILSLMFFFTAIKIGFIRSAGYTFIPPLLLLLPLDNRIRIKPLSVITNWLPYIVITFSFVLLEFIYPELINLFVGIVKSMSLSPVIDYITEYRGIDSSLNLTKLVFFFTHLFIPSGLVAEILPFFQSTFPKISLVLSLGIIIILCILFTLFITLRSRHKETKWLIIFASFFIILNMFHNALGYQAPDFFNPETNNFAQLFDREFSQESSGYGPGSRYIFSSAVGASLLFALFVYWLAKKGKKSVFFAILFCIIVIGGNTYFTIRAQINNFDGMNKYKSLVENIFKLVPRDGKPKLLFSTNPESNSLDRKFGGWEWLYGFYKENELYYSTDPKEVSTLIKNNHYTKDNLYAFFNNPHTLTFTDISEETRRYFFTKSENLKSDKSFEFPKPNNKSAEKKIIGVNTTIYERAIIESLPINERIITEEDLNLKFRFKKLSTPTLPLSDAFFTEKGKISTYNFPQKVWEIIEPPPLIFSNPELLKQRSNEKSAEKFTQILTILQDRKKLIANARVTVSDMEDKTFITAESLIDGFYTTHPNPTSQEHYFIAEENPTTVTISFPDIRYIKRILLNTPLIYTSSQYPKKITLSASLDDLKFDKIITQENLIPENWSPNKGAMTKIDLPKTINSRSLKLEITSARPVVLDEIVIDNEKAISYSPLQIHQTEEIAYQYVNTFELYQQLADIKSYDHLTLLWACAEDLDWKKQLREKIEIVQGIWHATKINIPYRSNEFQDKVVINCFGSYLRKIFFIGPPYPVEMELIEAVLK